MAQLRFGILPLRVETGRFTNLDLENRTCLLCNREEVEDECHFLFACPKYNTNRETWGNIINSKCECFHYLELCEQLSFLFNNVTRATAKFIVQSFTERQQTIFK